MAKKSDQVQIVLKAFGERSKLTTNVMVEKGGTITVSADDAAAAVATGRWAYADAAATEGAEGEGPK
jgi:hypothetical protein